MINGFLKMKRPVGLVQGGKTRWVQINTSAGEALKGELKDNRMTIGWHLAKECKVKVEELGRNS